MTSLPLDPDHGLFEMRGSENRKRVEWPNGALLAATVSILVSVWEIHPPTGSVRDGRMRAGFGPYEPDYWSHTTREYGNRVGIHRMLDVLDRLGCRATVAFDSIVCDQYPGLVARTHKLGHEIAAHGECGSRMHSSAMDVEAERTSIANSRDALTRLTSTIPSGWFGPGRGESPMTPSLVAEAGFTYLSDWPNDDSPYLLHTEPAIVSLPRPAEYDDAEVLHVRHNAPAAYPDSIKLAADQMAKEGDNTVLHLTFHPWILGQPNNIKYCEEALTILQSDARIWLAPARDVVSAARKALVG